MAVICDTKTFLDETARAQILCANPDCWRRLCRDVRCSSYFCCYMCESKYFGNDMGCSHGQACSKKHKPEWDAPRAPAMPTSQGSVDSDRRWRSRLRRDGQEERCWRRFQEREELRSRREWEEEEQQEQEEDEL